MSLLEFLDRTGKTQIGSRPPGAIIGGVVDGVLGHQIGGRRGNDVATALGAVGRRRSVRT